MTQILQRITFSGESLDFKVAFCIVIIWMIILGCTTWSIWERNMETGQKRLWTVIVTVFPLIGVLAYIPTNITSDMLSSLPFVRSRKG